MSLTSQQILKIENIVKSSLLNKLQNYKPESISMPFHTRLLGKDRMALFSFIHSLNTNFGTSIFEPVAKAIAEVNFRSVSIQQIAGEKISSEAQISIQSIIDRLSSAKTDPNKLTEIAELKNVCRLGEMKNVKLTKVDLKLVAHDGTIFLIDLKTAKPNIGEFKGYKRTLLEWVAAVLADNPNVLIHSLIAIPYNPYEPQPYNRWTMRGMLDLNYELKVADEFWDFLGGAGTYVQLLEVFEKVGIELHPEIDTYFAKYKQF
ncbi:MAG: TdeIII family type II restriction endonuclease [Bacteroidales bacterium]|nr:TdeIII family type II restriction endonuclease [Bacteroidales bacterium]